MCEELNDELKEGHNAAIKLAEHLKRMGAGESKMTIVVEGREVLITVTLGNKTEKPDDEIQF